MRDQLALIRRSVGGEMKSKTERSSAALRSDIMLLYRDSQIDRLPLVAVPLLNGGE